MKAWGNAPGTSIIAVKQSAESAIHPGWVEVETRFQRWVLGFTDPGALPQASRLNAAPLAPNTSQEPRATLKPDDERLGTIYLCRRGSN
jgi:hypothetical protein